MEPTALATRGRKHLFQRRPEAHCAFSRLTTLADKPLASSPSSTLNASPMSPVDIPFRYSQGSAALTRGDFLTYGGTIVELNFTPDPDRSRTFGTFTASGPAAVNTSRSGK